MRNGPSIANRPHRVFNADQIEAVLRDLRESDPDWTYTPVYDPKGSGKAFVEIYDEDGEFVGRV